MSVTTRATGSYVTTASGVDDLLAGFGGPVLRPRWKPTPAQIEHDPHLSQQLLDVFSHRNQRQTALQERSPVYTIFLDSHLQRFGTLAVARMLLDMDVQQHMFSIPMTLDSGVWTFEAGAAARIFYIDLKLKHVLFPVI